MVYIEPVLSSAEKKAEFDKVRGTLIAHSKRYSRIVKSRTKRSLEIEKKGKKESLRYSEDEVKHDLTFSQSVTLVTQEISDLLEGFRANRITLPDCLKEYRLRVPEWGWPTVLVYVPEMNCSQNLNKEMEGLGYRIVDNTYNDKESPENKLALFNLLHVRIPPEPDLVSPLAAITGVEAIYDGDRIISVPIPITIDQHLELELADSIPIMWPPETELPNDMPPPGKGVKLCIIDSGIDDSHPDLVGRVIARRDFTAEQNNIDSNGHGTHCAGIVSGSGAASGEKLKGIAPNAQLMAAKVFDRYGNSRISDILVAMRWAYDEGAEIVSMSLGASGIITDGQSILTRACTTLGERDVVICVSAGNNGPELNTITVPADSPLAITVGAIHKDRSVCHFSSRGPTDAPEITGIKPNVVSPGAAIISCRSNHSNLPPYQPNPMYTMMSGTSMACPHVTGAMAVLLSYMKSLDLKLPTSIIRLTLEDTAIKLPNYRDADQGKGLINIPNALSKIASYASEKAEAGLSVGPAQEGIPMKEFELQPIEQTREMLAATTSQVPSALSQVDPGNCSACGKKISTRIDIAGNCQVPDCQGKICSNCWTVKNKRCCKEHSRVS